jgi:hypothetical protein
MPTAVHIFDFPTPASSQSLIFIPKLRSILTHNRPVHHVRWNPTRNGSLALCCGSRSVYTWSNEWVGVGSNEGEEEEMAECIGIPTSGLL